MIVSLLLFFTACRGERGELWAEVNENQLYEYDAEEMMIAKQLSPENEAHVAKFIDDWIDMQLVNAETAVKYPETYRDLCLATN